jgi:hypothetical protein
VTLGVLISDPTRPELDPHLGSLVEEHEPSDRPRVQAEFPGGAAHGRDFRTRQRTDGPQVSKRFGRIPSHLPRPLPGDRMRGQIQRGGSGVRSPRRKGIETEAFSCVVHEGPKGVHVPPKTRRVKESPPTIVALIGIRPMVEETCDGPVGVHIGPAIVQQRASISRVLLVDIGTRTGEEDVQCIERLVQKRQGNGRERSGIWTGGVGIGPHIKSMGRHLDIVANTCTI